MQTILTSHLNLYDIVELECDVCEATYENFISSLVLQMQPIVEFLESSSGRYI